MEESELIKSLQNANLYDHDITTFEIIETHISWIILTGNFAYKIKKPVTFPFLDYSTLSKRHHYCLLEFKLNKILAPELYRDVMAIGGTSSKPYFTKNDSDGIIEYAIRMHQFDQNLLFSNLVKSHSLAWEHMNELSIILANFHQITTKSNPKDAFGNIEHILNPMLENFEDCQKMLKSYNINTDIYLKKLNHIKKISEKILNEKLNDFKQRKQNGFIRDCHGDLHLGNIVLYLNKPLIFDRIEFNEFFRFIDVTNDIAFLIMDLEEKGFISLSFYFLNHYLARTGDYEGLSLLNFYKLYRAMIRAKIALMSPGQPLPLFQHYLDYCYRICEKNDDSVKPSLMITYGVSGSGKTTLSEQLAIKLSVIHIRSDVERIRVIAEKVNNGNKNNNDNQNHQDELMYSDENITKVYQHLFHITEQLLKWNYSVIVDATFLSKAKRALFLQLAKNLELPFFILQCTADVEELKKRIQHRVQKNDNISLTKVEILKMQLEKIEPLTEEEKLFALSPNLDSILDVLS